MPILIDDELREFMPYKKSMFPITYFHDELGSLPEYAGPLHWHDGFEIAMADSQNIDYQIGEKHVILEKGDVIFLNGNVLHRIRQVSGKNPDKLPNVVFSGTIIAPETSLIYQKYIQPVSQDNTLPYIVFKRNIDNVCKCADNMFNAMEVCADCYELIVQREIINIFEYIVCHYDEWQKVDSSRIQMKTKIRVQKMISYIHNHYSENVTLEDISKSANISRSEAARCFKTYMGCSPIDALLRHRVQLAQEMLRDTTKTIDEISAECGFNSANYFCRQFKRIYQVTPSLFRKSLGK